MPKEQKCSVCENEADKMAIALCKKIINRNAKKFYCISCLANYLDTTVEELEEKAAEFKEEGCTLFK